MLSSVGVVCNAVAGRVSSRPLPGRVAGPVANTAQRASTVTSCYGDRHLVLYGTNMQTNHNVPWLNRSTHEDQQHQSLSH